MSKNDQFDWVKLYKELTGKLLDYKSNRDLLVEKVKKIFEIAEINIPKLEQDYKLVDIDPFTFFGLFNKKITDVNRIKLLEAIAEQFNIKSPVPKSFASLPVLSPQNATFYYFLPGRGDNDIQDLWGLYDYALVYAKYHDNKTLQSLSGYFDRIIRKKGNGNSKITMGLYWIAPDTFLNLDQRNVWYIYESGKLPRDFVNTLPKVEHKISASVYFEITNKVRTFLDSGRSRLKNFKELSFEAWRYSEEVNQEEKRKIIESKRDTVGEAIADKGVETTHYWIFAPGDGATYWDEFYNDGIMAIGWDEIGDLSQYNSKDEMRQAMKEIMDPSRSYKHSAHATWQFANEMKPGDVVFAKKGRHIIVGRGIVKSDYEFDDTRSHDKNTRRVEWTDKGEWSIPVQTALKTLTDVTAYSDYVAMLNDLFEDDITDDPKDSRDLKPYDAEMFLDEVYMDKKNYMTLVSLLKKKKNVILQGAPGVGKTFAAKRLAYSIMGVKDPERVMMVQFHQSYSYEDFIMGYRPTQEGGFTLEKGVFYEFCKSAEEDDEDTPYFFIIDEINRGNLSKIFGELFMLIESDKRGIELKLLYKDEKFSIPKNVHIIGMMNTADRSLAMMDYALRRRFAFFNMEPGFDTDGFRRYRDDLNSDKFNSLISCVENLNTVISNDESLGEGFCIGHSYFCDLNEASDQALSEIVEFELVPLLKEYWFDEPIKSKTWIDNLRSSIK